MIATDLPRFLTKAKKETKFYSDDFRCLSRYIALGAFAWRLSIISLETLEISAVLRHRAVALVGSHAKTYRLA
jgi:hypothetical protein